ncbi:MAG: hypothetical protein ACKO72_11880 [Actinomycetes bacterium]
MTTVVVLVIIGLLIAAVILIAALEPGPSTSDLALAYEHAWDRLDFGTVWALSAQELRDGLDRRAYVRAKRAAYESADQPADLVATVAVADLAEAGDVAAAITSLVLHDGSIVHHEVRMGRRMGRWEVTGYTLRAEDAPH